MLSLGNLPERLFGAEPVADGVGWLRNGWNEGHRIGADRGIALEAILPRLEADFGTAVEPVEA